MGSNLVKPVSSKDGSETAKFSSYFTQQHDDLPNGPLPVSEKQLHSFQPVFDGSMAPMDQNVMVVLYDFTATMDSQLTVKRGEAVRVLGYSPIGDWTEVEAPFRLPNQAPRVAWTVPGASSAWVRGWVPTTYLAAPSASSNPPSATNSADWSRRMVAGTVSRQPQQGEDVMSSAMAAYPWYHGPVSRRDAEQLLRSGITGSYLVRESESAPGQLSVTVRKLGRVYHYRISRDTSGWYFITETHRFPTVVQLIHHHSLAADGLICPLLYPAARREHPSASSLLCHSSSAGGSVDGGACGNGVGLDDWEIDRSEIMMRNKLGWGQYGDVYEALWRRYNSIVAVKTLKQDVDLNLSEFLAEAAIMKNLQHENLVRLLGVCTREPPYYIVTEYMPYGNLLNYLRQRSPGELPPPVLLYMAVQIASGMAYLEANNFIHRDLAARNCLVGEQHTIKVADFGLARCVQLHEDAYTARNGAKFPIKWTAPEGLAYFRFSTKSDMWAFGVVLWELATYGLSPYPGVELHGVYQLLEKGYRMERPRGCPEAIYNIMLRCWSWEAADRPTFAEVKVELEEMRRTIDMTEAVAQELATTMPSTQEPMQRPHPHQNRHHTHQHRQLPPGAFNTNGAATAAAAAVVPGSSCCTSTSVDDEEEETGSVSQSGSSPSSSRGVVETDGGDGDDEGDDNDPLHLTGCAGGGGGGGSSTTTRTVNVESGFYQGDYIVGGGDGGGGSGSGAPASDLPLHHHHHQATNVSQLSAPASLPPSHRRCHQKADKTAPMQQAMLPQPQLSGSSVTKKRAQGQRIITPAESGVGESIVSADSPGLEKGARQTTATASHQQQSAHRREAVMAMPQQPTMVMMMQPGHQMQQQQQQHLVMEAGGGRSEPRRKKSLGSGGGNHCITPTGDLAEDKQRLRLDAESMNQFTTLPAQDRITRYLESLGELGGHVFPPNPHQQTRQQQAPPPHIALLPHFPPPPAVPPPPPQGGAQRGPPTAANRNSSGGGGPQGHSERRRAGLNRSASCYQTVPSVPLPPQPQTQQAPSGQTNGWAERRQRGSNQQLKSPSLPEAAAAVTTDAVNGNQALTSTDDVYQAPNIPQTDSANEPIADNGGRVAPSHSSPSSPASNSLSSSSPSSSSATDEVAELSAVLSRLSVEATALSAACPPQDHHLAGELASLSQQLSECRAQVPSSSSAAGQTEGECLGGIAQALRHIQEALSDLRVRIAERQQQQQEEVSNSSAAPTPVST